MKIQGIVEESNKRGVKLDGKWYNYLRYADEEILRPGEGMEVELEVRKGLIQKLKVLKTTPGISPARRPPVLKGFTESVKTSYGDLYITVNTLEGEPFEVLLRMDKSNYGVAANCEIIGRLISLVLRSGVSVEEIVEELQSINKASVLYSVGISVSILDAVTQVLGRDFLRKPRRELENSTHLEHCPSCNTKGSLAFQGSCSTCYSCGFTDCY